MYDPIDRQAAIDLAHECEVYSLITYENFFCASAERRTDEQTD